MSNSSEKTRRLVGMGIFTALVVVLQLVASGIHVGPVSFSLVLIPIVVGAAVYGPAAGAILGAVFGLVVVVGTVSGADAGAYILFTTRPFWCILVIMLKGTLAGWFAGLTYSAISKKPGREMLAVILAAVVCPVTNTGIFCLAMATLFRETLISWAGGVAPVYYIFVGLIGVNFLVELAINVVLCPTIARIISSRKKGSA